MELNFGSGFKFGMGFWLAFIVWGLIPGILLSIAIAGIVAAIGGAGYTPPSFPSP